MARIVYFSNVTENTHRFVTKLGQPAIRIPTRPTDEPARADEPFVLIVPTYGSGDGTKAVPRQVVKFLNDPDNRSLLRGVIATGNTNFGADYCLAGTAISIKCQVPVLYRLELHGTPDDVLAVREGLEQFWTRQ